MKACGIVAEYNPFHKGHAYQIKKIKEESDADVIIAVMSGNFLQRGEPAIVDKWTRAKMALNSGVDLIIELPVHWSVQPADLFAKGSIRLLSEVEIDYLSFGTEDGEASDFYEAARFLNRNEKKISGRIAKDSRMNMSYAEKMERIIFELNPEFPLDLASPNAQLGLSYQRELFDLDLENSVKLLPIKRLGPSYREKKIHHHPFIASATAIRETVFAGEDYTPYLDSSTIEIFKNKLNEKVSWDSFF
ncbi:MAG: nucleotidyltransferase family protein, partial [Atopostipes suicloacalis]|nr:nucleotidyltransferase family protein [Atopostipes suicloacalis]